MNFPDIWMSGRPLDGMPQQSTNFKFPFNISSFTLWQQSNHNNVQCFNSGTFTNILKLVWDKSDQCVHCATAIYITNIRGYKKAPTTTIKWINLRLRKAVKPARLCVPSSHSLNRKHCLVLLVSASISLPLLYFVSARSAPILYTKVIIEQVIKYSVAM